MGNPSSPFLVIALFARKNTSNDLPLFPLSKLVDWHLSWW